MTKIKAKIQLRRDTSANFTTKNPTLLLGEFAFETDTMTVTESGSVSVKLKIGDGVNPWSELPYTTFGFAAVNWDDISGKPTEFTPVPHEHEITDVIGLQTILDAIADSIPSIEGLATVTYVDQQDALKVDKVTGKGLSTEDYTTAEKTKLAGIAEGAEVNVNADWNATTGDAVILNKPTIPAPVTSVSKIDHDVKLGIAMTIGTPVYVPLAQDSGNNMTVLKASNASEATSSKTMGLIATGGALNDIVKVITEGLLSGVNTGSATKGDPIWLGVDGALIFGLANKPVAPAHLVFLGVVTRAQTNNGEIFVKVQNGFEIDELHNVATSQSKSMPVDADAVLLYDSADANGLWKKLTWANVKATLKTYFDGIYTTTSAVASQITTALSGYATQASVNSKENSANKQNSLAVDGSGTKFPTVDAVNAQSMMDKGKAFVSFWTDFLSAVTTLDGLIQSTSGGIISNSGTSVPNRTNQQGVLYYSTATATTNYANHVNAIPTILWFGGGVWNYETSININNLSTAAERYRWISGFGANTANVAEIDGIFFTYDEGGTLNGTAASPNWQCVTVANSVRTLTTTSIAVTSGTWIKLRIEINAAGTSVAFYVNGTLVATHTTNIPLASNNRFVLVKQGVQKVTGTTARLIYCDYLGYENILTTPR